MAISIEALRGISKGLIDTYGSSGLKFDWQFGVMPAHIVDGQKQASKGAPIQEFVSMIDQAGTFALTPLDRNGKPITSLGGRYELESVAEWCGVQVLTFNRTDGPPTQLPIPVNLFNSDFVRMRPLTTEKSPTLSGVNEANLGT